MGQSLGFTHFLQHADAVAWAVLVLLVVMSLASWYSIAAKGVQWLRDRRGSRAYLASFDDVAQGDVRLQRRVAACGRGPYARVADEAFEALDRHDSMPVRAAPGATREAAPASPAASASPVARDELLARTLKRSIVHQCAALEAGQTLLATVASTAPFVGLFGTVWGIYHALLAIGDAGAAGLQEVAGPVGEALIMTGLGLAVALPASAAYNAFTRTRRNLRIGLESFAHELFALLIDGMPPRRLVRAAQAGVYPAPPASARAGLQAPEAG